jgi:hypothetical protein
MRPWCVVCIAVLADLHPSLCAKTKLPSWRGPDTFFAGTQPSSRSDHRLTSVDGWIYLFGGNVDGGEMKCVDDGEAKMPYRDCMPLR